jgi:hypothetical protein
VITAFAFFDVYNKPSSTGAKPAAAAKSSRASGVGK